jgi:hypothetical protein
MIAYNFLLIFTGVTILIQGTTPVKTMLYQRKITRYWSEISILFEVNGLINDEWEPFRNGINYDAFIGRLRDGAVFI